MCASRNTDAGRGWLRLGWDNPACYSCAVWVPARWGSGGGDGPDIGQLTDVRVARLNTRICRN